MPKYLRLTFFVDDGLIISKISLSMIFKWIPACIYACVTINECAADLKICSLQGSTPCGMRNLSFLSAFPSWPCCGLWWRTTTQHPRMITLGSTVCRSPAFRTVGNYSNIWKCDRGQILFRGHLLARKY